MSTRTVLTQLFEAYQEHPIAYMRIYSKITGSVTAGILLSQIVYWDGIMNHREFYKTDKDFCDELAMGSTELANAKRAIRAKEIVSITRRGIPAKTHYKLDIDKLIVLLSSCIDESIQVDRKTLNNELENTSTITDITSESTSKINNYHNLQRDGALQNKPSNKGIKNILLHVEDNPSNHNEINDAVKYYVKIYKKMGVGLHPNISAKQWEHVKINMEVFSENKSLDCENWCEMIDSWFDSDVDSDFNINHFVSEGVLNTEYFKSCTSCVTDISFPT